MIKYNIDHIIIITETYHMCPVVIKTELKYIFLLMFNFKLKIRSYLLQIDWLTKMLYKKVFNYLIKLYEAIL